MTSHKIKGKKKRENFIKWSSIITQHTLRSREFRMPVNFMWPFRSPRMTVGRVYVIIQGAPSVFVNSRKSYYRHKFHSASDFLKFNPYVPIWPFAFIQNMNIVECDLSLFEQIFVIPFCGYPVENSEGL